MINGEDSSGRARLDLQDPEAVVKRVFAISDAFYDTVEARGDMREIKASPEDQAAFEGKMARIKMEEEYHRPEKTTK
jgi:hypothetical protein